jgi:O-antigen ligase
VLSLEGLAAAGLVGSAGLLAAEAVRARAWRGGAAAAWASRWWMLWPFLLWALLGPWLAGHPPRGTGVARLLDWAALPVAAAALARVGPATRWRLAGVWGAVLLASCLAAGLQHFGAWPAPTFFEPLSFLRMNFDRMTEEVPGAPGRFMGGGLHFHRLKFAHTAGLAVLWALAAGLAALAHGRAGGRGGRGGAEGLRGAAWLLGVAAVGTGAVLAFPFARAASAALLVAAAVLVALWLPRRLALALSAGVLLAGLLAVGLHAPLRERFLSSASQEGSGDRAALLATGVRAVREHPVAGVGLARFTPARFALPGASDEVRVNPGKAHNQLVSVAAETGLVGAALFLLLLLALASRLARGLRARPPRFEAAAGLASLAFFALLSLAHDPLFQAPFSMALALALGAARTRDEPPASSSAPSSPAAPAAA